MATFPSRLFIIVVLLLGQSVFAQEEVPEDAPLPQRDTPVPKIEGYADWKFTDSLETLQSDNRLTFYEEEMFFALSNIDDYRRIVHPRSRMNEEEYPWVAVSI